MKEKLYEAMRFGIVGVVATLIQYGVYYLLLPYMDERIALTTFKVKASPKNAGGFALSHFLNWSLQVVSLSFFIWLGVPKEWAPIPMYMVCVPVNFLMVRFFVKR